MERIKLVECTEQYWEFVRILRNDVRVADGFIQNKFITPDEQIKYMNQYADCYRVAFIGDTIAGYVGVIDDDIRICVHPHLQNLGIGKFMINEAMKIWPSAFAKVKVGNEASLRLFKSCGFSEKYVILTKD